MSRFGRIFQRGAFLFDLVDAMRMRIFQRGAFLFDLVDAARMRICPARHAWLLSSVFATAVILISSHGTQADGAGADGAQADGAQADGAEDQYAVAASFYAQKQWDLAAEEFTLFLDRYPQDAKAAEGIYYLGEIFLQSGQLEKAQKRFDQYLREHPKGKFRRAAAFRAAETAYLASNNARAKLLLEAFKRRYPKDNLNACVLPYFGGIALFENDANTAAEAFRSGLTQFPRGRMQDDCRLGLARALDMQGKRQESRQLFEAIAAKSAGRLADEAQFRLGASFYEAEEYAEAARSLEKITEKNSSNNRWRDHALLLRASAFVEQKRFKEAIRPLRAYLDSRSTPDGKNTAEEKENSKNEIRVLGQLAICYLRVGNFEKAKTCHARLMEEHAGHELIASTVEKMAEDALEMGESVWSARLFEWLAEDSGREEYEISGLSGLAWSRLENNQNALASSTFERLLLKKIDPSLAAEAAFVRGRLLDDMQRFDGALAMYDQVIKAHASSPQHPKALLAAARVRVRLSRTEEAVRLYRRLAQEYASATNMDVVLYEWSWALHDLGRLEQSTQLLRQLHREQPLSRFWPDATYRLAAVAFDAGDNQGAGELVERIIAAAKNNTSKTDSNSSTQESLVLAYAFRLKWQIAALRGKWDEVGRDAARLLAECPQSDLRPVAEYWVAESMYRRGEYESAAKRLDALSERAAERDAERAEPWTAMAALRRAQIYVHQKQWSRALFLASKIPAKFPDFEQQHEVDYLRGRCRASRAEFEEARRAYLRVIRSPRGAKTETAAMAQWMTAETYFHQKDYRSALKAYHRVEILYDYPKWQAAALLQAAKCQRRLGRHEEASKLYRRLMDKFPKSPFVEEAARRLRTSIR